MVLNLYRYVLGAGGQGELFRVKHNDGASLDFVGPTVGALECAPGGPVGTVVAGQAPPKPEVSVGHDNTDDADTETTSTFIVEGEDRDTSSCAGRPGLNLKGELLDDGAKRIKDKAEDCCQDCADLPECNVWVFCEVGDSLTPGGCQIGYVDHPGCHQLHRPYWLSIVELCFDCK